jgi:hypothetical protein
MTDGPQNPGDLGHQNLKYLRFVDPEDPTAIIQLGLVDTGLTTVDNIPIYAQLVDTGEWVSKTILSIAAASVAPSATLTGDTKELKNNKGIAITTRCEWNASATAGAIIWIETSKDGTNWDTVKFVTALEPPLVAGTTTQKTILMDSAPKYIRAKIQNLDATYGLPTYIDATIVE